MAKLRIHPILAATFVLLLVAGPAVADVFYVLPIRQLDIVAGEWPEQEESPRRSWNVLWRRRPAMQPYAVLDGEGEVYVDPDYASAGRRWPSTTQLINDNARIAIRLAKPRQLSGTLYVPQPDLKGMEKLEFTLPADQGSEAKQKEFLDAKRLHYQFLQFRNIPGSAWFRHQARQARQQLGLDDESVVAPPTAWNRRDSMERTYSLISGGRAISENLQLDRLLPEAEAEATTVALDSIKGITIEEFDWKKLNEGANPKRDPLARLIPDDQYAILFPSFQALVDLADNASEQGTVVLRAAETRAEDARVRERYEQQLGLSLTELARQLGPALINSVALTGSDPYLRTGADLAVLFEAKDVNTLLELVKAQVAADVGERSSQFAIEGKMAGTSYSGYRSPDRSLCSYIAKVGDAVVVTNSPVQLERLVRVSQGELPSLDSLGEYTFFRHRYPLGAEQETGLLILSDNTIRRWCGPRWRIAASRRSRAAALMADLQATYLDRLVAGQVQTGPLHTDLALPDIGELQLSPAGVRSSAYGTLEFLTPIAELEFDKVTKSEKDFYERWRSGYERNWRAFFDPIAVQFHASPTKLGIDLTVMPLIDFSAYQQLVSVSRGAQLKPDSGDPHPESLVHWVLALNTESQTVQQWANVANGIARVDPLSWIGDSIAVYADQDPYWKELAKLNDERERREFMETHASRVPVAMNFEVKSTVKLITFLAGLRTFIEQVAPGMTLWETLEYKEQPYVKISASEQARTQSAWDDMAIYYVASSEALVVAVSENVLHRAIDRQIARRQQAVAREKSPPSALPWLGENLCATVSDGLLRMLTRILGQTFHERMQVAAWSNLPILNEWHARYPDRDPLEIHQQFWQTKLVSPGGGEYRWNPKWHTMESSVYGHPGEPRWGAELPVALQAITSGNFGLTFEESGLRSRVQLTRDAKE